MVAISILPANPKVAAFSTCLAALTFYSTLGAQPYYLDEVGLLNLISLGMYAPMAILLMYDTYRRRSDKPLMRLTARPTQAPTSRFWRTVYNAKTQLVVTMIQCGLWLGFIGIFVADLYTEYSNGAPTLACPSSRCGSYFFALSLSYLHFFLIFTQLISFSLVLIEIKTSPRRVTNDRTISQLLAKSMEELAQLREEAKRVRAEMPDGGRGDGKMRRWLSGGRLNTSSGSGGGHGHGGEIQRREREYSLEGEIGGSSSNQNQEEQGHHSKMKFMFTSPGKGNGGSVSLNDTDSPSSAGGGGGARRRTRTISAEAGSGNTVEGGDSVVFSLRSLTSMNLANTQTNSTSAQSASASGSGDMGLELRRLQEAYRSSSQNDNGRYPPPYSTDGPGAPLPSSKTKIPGTQPVTIGGSRLSVRFDLAEAYELPLLPEDVEGEEVKRDAFGMMSKWKDETPTPYSFADDVDTDGRDSFFKGHGHGRATNRSTNSIAVQDQHTPKAPDQSLPLFSTPGGRRVLYPLISETPTPTPLLEGMPGLSFSPASTTSTDSPPTTTRREETKLLKDKERSTSSRKGKKGRWGIGKKGKLGLAQDGGEHMGGYFDLELQSGR
nr:uncharacterized protein CI109_002344 [Kwoniella shandongensis]KAA5529451.1 hypothetical protein CI109_002344 [Kwoniella shandongensis]